VAVLIALQKMATNAITAALPTFDIESGKLRAVVHILRPRELTHPGLE
jgi:hypothetical protein